jgi:LysR family transcriptional regulator, hypochlorite-specific transcription factor HypT
MESKWLEDFIALAESGSFSKSALTRNVTQPAFSRRIQSLESWLGVDLIDRSSYPTRLTAAGSTFYTQAVEMLTQISAARAMARGTTTSASQVIDFALPHTLSLIYFPSWLSALETDFGQLRCRLVAANVHDAAMRLVDGGCDLLMSYHHPQHPIQLDASRYESITLGFDQVLPYSRAEQGKPKFLLPGKANAPLPFLSYTSGAYLNRMADLILRAQKKPPVLQKVYETDMAEGLKVMALQGHGLAFLPENSVHREVAEGRLLPAFAPDLTPSKLEQARQQWGTQLEIRLFRERPQAGRPGKAVVDRLWRYLVKG